MDEWDALFTPPLADVEPVKEALPAIQPSSRRNVIDLQSLSGRNAPKLDQAKLKAGSQSKRDQKKTAPRKSRYDDLRPLVFADYRTGMYSDEALRKKYEIKSRSILGNWIKSGNWQRDLSRHVVRERAILEAQTIAKETVERESRSAGVADDGASNGQATSNPPSVESASASARPGDTPDQSQEMSDSEIVRAAAAGQMSIITQHRTELRNLRQLIGEMFGELRTTNAIAKDARGLKTILVDLLMLEASDSVSEKSRNEARARAIESVKRVMELPARADILRKLSGALKEAVPLERLSYGLETSLSVTNPQNRGAQGARFSGSKQDGPRPVDATPLEERIRTYTAEAQATGRKTLEPAARVIAA